jgi:hypothetical protein
MDIPQIHSIKLVEQTKPPLNVFMVDSLLSIVPI